MRNLDLTNIPNIRHLSLWRTKPFAPRSMAGPAQEYESALQPCRAHIKYLAIRTAWYHRSLWAPQITLAQRFEAHELPAPSVQTQTRRRELAHTGYSIRVVWPLCYAGENWIKRLDALVSSVRRGQPDRRR